MSTNDCPGYRPENHDELANGCWAEHDDGTLLYVEGVEAKRVIYAIFEMAQKPIIEYRDAMTETDFKKQFSWDPKNKRSIKWTWHDKTPFPWGKVLKGGSREGARFADVEEEIEQASRLAVARKKRRTEKTKQLPAPKEVPKRSLALREAPVAVADVPETAAQQIAGDRALQARRFDAKAHEHQVEQVVGKQGLGVIKRIQKAISVLRRGE